MTFRKHTELQEKSWNGAHRSTVTHIVETNCWKQLDRSRRMIMARDELRSDRQCGWRWMTKDGSHPEINSGMIWIVTGYGWMTRGG